MARNNAINVDALPIAVPGGGTGLSSVTNGSILVGSGVNALNQITPTTTGELLVATSSSDPSFSDTMTTGGSFIFRGDTDAVPRVLTVSNTDNTAAATSQATVVIQCGGTSGGDPAIYYRDLIRLAFQGIDNSNADGFMMSFTAPSPYVTITTGGSLNYPETSFFHAHNNTLRTNVGAGTGVYTAVTVVMNSSDFDNQFEYNTSTGEFTALTTGVYIFSLAMALEGVTSTQTGVTIQDDTSTSSVGYGQLFDGNGSVFSSSGDMTVSGGTIYQLTAGDVFRGIYGDTLGTPTTDIPASTNTYFAGKYIG